MSSVGLTVSWVQVLGGALAAMSSAVLLSTVGVAGTMVGAAVGSVAATVGGAVYSHYLSRSHQRVAAARRAALKRAARSTTAGAAATSATEAVRTEQEVGGEPEPDREPETDLEAPPVEGEDPEPKTWRQVLRGLRWKRIVLVSLGIFVLAMTTIVAFELISGRAVSSYTGGTDDSNGPRTSIPFGDRSDGRKQPTPEPTPAEQSSDTRTDVTGTETPTPTTQATRVPDRGRNDGRADHAAADHHRVPADPGYRQPDALTGRARRPPPKTTTAVAAAKTWAKRPLSPPEAGGSSGPGQVVCSRSAAAPTAAGPGLGAANSAATGKWHLGRREPANGFGQSADHRYARRQGGRRSAGPWKR